MAPSTNIATYSETKAIKLDGANDASPAQSATQRWNALSPTAKIAIGASVGGVFAVCMGVFAFCCIRQRRAGKHEKLVEDAKFEKERTELMAYRAEMGRLRSEKQVMGGSMHSGYGPVPQTSISVMGATVGPGGRNISGGSNPGYANPKYAQSVSTLGSGRGYQRY